MPSEDWQPQYSFDLAAVAPDDLEQANHWTSTRPGTRFTTLHIASIASSDGFAAMTDGTLKVYGGSSEAAPVIVDASTDYAKIMRNLFFLDFSDEDAAALPLFGQLRRIWPMKINPIAPSIEPMNPAGA